MPIFLYEALLANPLQNKCLTSIVWIECFVLEIENNGVPGYWSESCQFFDDTEYFRLYKRLSYCCWALSITNVLFKANLQ